MRYSSSRPTRVRRTRDTGRRAASELVQICHNSPKRIHAPFFLSQWERRDRYPHGRHRALEGAEGRGEGEDQEERAADEAEAKRVAENALAESVRLRDALKEDSYKLSDVVAGLKVTNGRGNPLLRDLQDLEDTVSIVEGNRQKFQLEEADVQARKDEIGRLIVENTALLGQLDAEKATLGEKKAQILGLQEDHDKVLSEKAALGAKQVMECLLCASCMPACICCLQAYTCTEISTCIKHARTNAGTHSLTHA